jgi:glucosylceramidase
VIAHAAKHVRPGSVRIYSDTHTALANVAFLTPSGHVVLIVLNDGAQAESFCISYRNKNAAAHLPAGTVATYVWRTA